MEAFRFIKNILFQKESRNSVKDFRSLYFRADILQNNDFSLAVSERQF